MNRDLREAVVSFALTVEGSHEAGQDLRMQAARLRAAVEQAERDERQRAATRVRELSSRAG